MKTTARLGLLLLITTVGIGSPLPLISQAQPPPSPPTHATHEQAAQQLKAGLEQYRASQFHQALQTWKTARQLYRDLSDRQGEMDALSRIGTVYTALGHYGQAVGFQLEALSLARDLNNRHTEAIALGNLGVVHRRLGQYDQALNYYQQQRAIARQINNRQQEGNALSNIGIVYGAQSQYDIAISYFQEALAIHRSLNHQQGISATLNNLGLTYAAQGQYQNAISVYLESQFIQQQLGNRHGEAQVLSNLGLAYNTLGEYGKAIRYHQAALAIEQQVGARPSEAKSRGNLGIAYRQLGQYQDALRYHNQALKLFRQLQDPQGEAIALSNLGTVYHALKQYGRAIELHQQSMAIAQQLGDQGGVASSLTNLGLAYFAQGHYRKAIKFSKRALTQHRKIGDRHGETLALGNLGNAYYGRGQLDQAIAHYQQSLTLAKTLGLREAEGRYLTNLGLLLAEQDHRELAILFLKQAVNIRESIRKDLQRLPQTDQQAYTNKIAEGYRRLADLLLQADRVLEAQTVLDLLKLQELDDLLQDVRGTGEQLEFLQPELALLERFQDSQTSAIALIKELDQLTEQARAGKLSATQTQRRRDLLQIRRDLKGQFNTFLEHPQVQTLLKQLSQTASRESLDPSKLGSLQDNLANLNGVLLYPLVLEDRLELVLTTPTAPPLRRVVPVRRTDLNRTIADFRTALEHPHRDARPAAQQLYQWLIRPIIADLDQLQAQTILFAPDGQLRYIPLAALHDGQQWLTQTYQITNITTTSQTDFDTVPHPHPRLLAGAFTDDTRTRTIQTRQRSWSFKGLPFAGQEVKTLVAAQPGATALFDQEWTLERTLEEIDLHQVLHFATHAAFVPGDPDASFIVFGEGQNPTLRDIATWSLSHVDLVVLSGCETGLGGLGNGDEVLGLGYQFQASGAKAVVASLWQVSDGGTQILMTQFYQGLQQGLSKAAALRQAQIALIQAQGNEGTPERAALQVVSKNSPIPTSAPLAHPYYWAPFILIGNGL